MRSEMSDLSSSSHAQEIHKAVIRFIHDWTRDEGYPPTVKEIGTYMGWHSTSTTFQHLEAMEARGLITKRAKIPRTLRVTEKGYELCQ
jgi:repressor LexA